MIRLKTYNVTGCLKYSWKITKQNEGVGQKMYDISLL